MIDLHCHILPGLDDGAKTIQDSLEMARQAVREGITAIVASPHHRNHHYINRKSIIEQKVAELNHVLQQENIPLEILVGQENRIVGELAEDLGTTDDIATVNHKNYLLIEFPTNHVPNYSEQLFYQLQMLGLTPVIVHPERNTAITEDPDKLYQLIEKGAISQVTAASIAGAFGKKIQKFSLQLLESNLSHVIASDAHNVTNRSFKMREAFSVIEKEFGNDMVYMLQENAALIAEGNMIYREHPEKIKRKKFLGIF